MDSFWRVITWPFWNREQKRLRAGWRVFMQLFLFVLALAVSGIAAHQMGNTAAAPIVGSLLYIVLGLGGAWLMARFIDKRRFTDFGFHIGPGWFVDFFFGIALGAVIMSGIFFSMQAQGWVHVVNTYVTDNTMPFWGVFAIGVLIQLSVGINEELTFRGYQLRNIAEGFSGKPFGKVGGIVVAVLISSTVFGLAHLGNPNATALGAANIVLAGFLLALPYLLTGELSTSIGLHLSWNLFEGNVYGFAVSGGEPGTQMLDIDVTGPELWTGGDFGPEAGLMAVIWMFVGFALTLIWVRLRRGKLALFEGLAIYTPRG